MIPTAISAPNMTAVDPEPGIPSVSSGMNEPEQAALLAASVAARPRTAPLPNVSGSRWTFFSAAYDIKEAMVAPAPGKTPIKKPIKEPRSIVGTICLPSSLEILRDVTLVASG